MNRHNFFMDTHKQIQIKETVYNLMKKLLNSYPSGTSTGGILYTTVKETIRAHDTGTNNLSMVSKIVSNNNVMKGYG